MATRFYFHNAASTVSGTLPSTKQSAVYTASVNIVAQSINKDMDTTIGTSQASHSGNSLAQTTTQTLYFGKWVSDPIDTQSVSANTWGYYFAASESNAAGNFPVNGLTKTVQVTLYIWRPSTGAKIATLIDGNTVASFNEPTIAGSEYPCGPGTFTTTAGSATAGDVLIFEMWFQVAQGNATARTDTIYFDGTTVSSQSSGSTTASAAAYIETPQNITFYTPSTSIDMTPNLVTLTNKFITKV